ncbi:MAG: Asp-tRNA(Asn)/Glu-tRNA(Gln) amidotransferase subunit GatA [Vampirovibrionales bacterium]
MMMTLTTSPEATPTLHPVSSYDTPLKASALELAHAIQTQTIQATQVLDAVYAHIEAKDAHLGAFLSLTKEHAYTTAQHVDAHAKAGHTLPLLAGVPLALKDNIHLKGAKTTCASKLLQNFVACEDATVTQKLLANHLPIIGKTNLDEFAMGSSCENSGLGTSRNPWNPEYVPGGSSGGSAVAVASGMAPLALGSDTGGSVRLPSAFCALVGMKPTYGLVSRYGLVAYGSSLDQISPFARTVDDLAAILQLTAGTDPKDSTTRQAPEGWQAYPIKPLASLEGVTFGVIEELDKPEALQPEVAEAFQGSLAHLQALGATIKRVSIPSIKLAIPTYYLIATAEASANLARFDGVRYTTRTQAQEATDVYTMMQRSRGEGFGKEVKRRIMLGTFALSAGYYDAFYGKARKARALLAQEFQAALTSCDVLLSPTSATTAFKLGEKTTDPVQMYLSDIATVPVNLVGMPALSLPCGFDAKGLPIGLQMIGTYFSEPTLLAVAQRFEAQCGIRNQVAPVFA